MAAAQGGDRIRIVGLITKPGGEFKKKTWKKTLPFFLKPKKKRKQREGYYVGEKERPIIMVGNFWINEVVHFSNRLVSTYDVIM